MQTTENSATIATFLGAGPATIETVQALCARASILVALDGGVVHAAKAGCRPDIILGDLDSLPVPFPQDLQDVPQKRMPDQDSTDFDKALRATDADLYLCAGFTDGRTDHMLACFHSMMKWPARRAILVSESDVIALMPSRIEMTLPADTRVSIFPMRRGTASSHGLRWPLDGLTLEAGTCVSTSNAALGGYLELSTVRPHLLLTLPREHLDDLIPALLQSPQWPRD